MTSAPENLKSVRRLLLAHLDIHENSRAYPTDLDPEEVGIVGDPAHRGGYHCGRDRVDDDDYSVRESSRDRNGLTDAACALDIGQWSARVGGKTHDLRSMSVWLVAQCKANAPDTRDIREVIYSPDGSTVRRWDRLGRRSTGDSSHRWHTHISYHRDAIKAGRDQTMLFRRYLTSIGLLEDDMPLTDTDLEKVRTASALGLYDALYIAATGNDYRGLKFTGPGAIGSAIKANLGALTAGPVLSALTAMDHVDEARLAAELAPAVAAAVVASLPEDRDDVTVEELTEAFRRLIAPAGG